MEFWNVIQSWTNGCVDQFYDFLSHSLDSLVRTTNLFVPRSDLRNSPRDGETVVRHRFGSLDGQCPVCLMSLQLPVETNCGHLFCGNCMITYWRQPQWTNNVPIRCPVCRQLVTLILTCFRVQKKRANYSLMPTIVQLRRWLKTVLCPLLENIVSMSYIDSLLDTVEQRRESTSEHSVSGESTTESRTKQPEYVIANLNEYNRKFSNLPRPWIDYVYDLPALLRHLASDFFSTERIFNTFRVRIMFLCATAFTYLISPLDMIPEAVFGIIGLLDDILILLLVAIYATIIYRRFLSRSWQNESQWMREDLFEFD